MSWDAAQPDGLLRGYEVGPSPSDLITVAMAIQARSQEVSLQIRYWRQHEREEAADRVRTVGRETWARVTGLRPSTRYDVAVLAYNSAGTGPPSPRTTVTTRKPRTCLTTAICDGLR